MQNIAKQTKKVNSKKVVPTTESVNNNNLELLSNHNNIIVTNKNIIKESKKVIETNIKEIFNMFINDINILKQKENFKDFNKKALINVVLVSYDRKDFDNTVNKAINDISYYLLNNLSLDLNNITSSQLSKVIAYHSLSNNEVMKHDIKLFNPLNSKNEVMIKKGEKNPYYQLCTNSGIKANKNTIKLYLENLAKMEATIKANILTNYLKNIESEKTQKIA